MFSAFFIRRPVMATVISLVIVLGGFLALQQISVSRYPDIAPPTIKVGAFYPGANSEAIASDVASPIEQELNGLEGMLYMSSTSSNDGRMDLTVTFSPDVDLDAANVLVQNRVSSAEARLPESVKRQGVTVKKVSSAVAMYISVSSPNGTYDDQFLSNYVWQQIKDELARVNGVGDISVFGAGQFSMRLWLDPERLSSYNLTATDVINAVREQNVQVAGGRLGSTPSSDGTAYTYTVNVSGKLTQVDEFNEIIIRSSETGGLIRVKDVARVELGSNLYDISSQFNGKSSTTMAIYQSPGSNIIDVTDGVKAKLTELSKSFPQDLSYDIMYDNTDVVNASIHEVINTLIVALILVIFTVYIFLQNFRATLIPAITIPVSLIGTFAVLLILGYSLNQLTLFGLVLVIGIVVDDSIVVVENTSKWIAEGLKPKEAAIKAMKEVSGPVVATTLVLLAVFVPTMFMGGISGTLFKQFAVTISIATVFSSINALTLSPALCAILLKEQKPARGVFALFNKGLEKVTHGYIKITKMSIRVALLSVVLLVGVSLYAFNGLQKLPTGFVPQEDEGWCMVNLQLPDGASLARTKEAANEINQMIASVDGVQDCIAISGYSIIDGSASTNTAFFLVTFKPWSERNQPHLTQEAIVGQLNQKLFFGMKKGISYAFPMPSLPGVGTSGGFTYMLQDKSGAGLQQLETTARQFIGKLNQDPKIANANMTFRSTVPQVTVKVDREQVLKSNVLLSEVYNTLQIYLGSAYVNDFSDFGRIFQVTAQADSSFRNDIDAIGKLKVRNKDGNMVPLSSLISVEETVGPQTVSRFNLYPAVKIMGSAAPGTSSGEALTVIENLTDQHLQKSYGYNWADLSYQQKAAQGSTGMIFGLAILLVFLFLAAQYESWSLPISVIMAIPIALLGAIIAVGIRGYDNNVYTQIGIVLLIGLSTKSAILIVEFAKQLRDEGHSIYDAAIQATKMRFRAVMMTALSFILGVIPLLISSGAGAESQKVIGTSVFGGMIFATFICLATVPMMYYFIQKTVEWEWFKTSPVLVSTDEDVVENVEKEIIEEVKETTPKPVEKIPKTSKPVVEKVKAKVEPKTEPKTEVKVEPKPKSKPNSVKADNESQDDDGEA